MNNNFIGDLSHLKDRNSELLSNLKCKKLTYFKWYKDIFMTRVMQRLDNQQPFWKEKFLARLPTLLRDKVRNQKGETYKGIIPYENLTYGELISFTQKEGLKICQDLKLQKQLKKKNSIIMQKNWDLFANILMYLLFRTLLPTKPKKSFKYFSSFH
ncbi:Uncharacterized protein TCM_018581 [Theobroma cacao]|uniref:Uncharacterized protein n=1 Tax=Theobroma cacao TaxID=3641 RepID=A0A061EGG9_THECC|nr:Uncharacterized protein TCM_018581 [Theobroma cacao]